MKKVMLYTLCILSLAACQKDDELGSIDPGVGPAVHHLAVDENNNTLYIYGENFRNQKGSVTVGDVAVNDISNWSDKVIQCEDNNVMV